MRSLFTTRYGGPEVLEVREQPDPTPGPGQVLLAVERAGVNFADIAARLGLYPDAPPPPMVVGYEVSGTVLRLGPQACAPPPGTPVLALTRFGGHADRVVVPAEQVVPLPPGMTLEHGAALPVNYLTAYHMLFHVGRLRPGSRVLIHMAAGGVGLAALQLCQLEPDTVVFGTASASKHERLRQAGVRHPIDYRTQDYAAEVRRITQGKGVDLVLDALGGADWKKGYDLLAPAGQLIAFGWSNMVSGEHRNWLRLAGQLLSMKRYSPYELINQNKTVSGVNLGHLWEEKALLSRHLQALLALYAAGKIAPQVDRVFPLSEAAAAHRHIQARQNVGKVLFDCTR